MSVQPKILHLRLDGSLTIGHTKDLREQLLDVIRTSPRVEVDCSVAQEVDAAFVQLLVATRRYAQAGAKRFGVRAPVGGALWKAVERGGFNPADLALEAAMGDFKEGAS